MARKPKMTLAEWIVIREKMKRKNLDRQRTIYAERNAGATFASLVDKYEVSSARIAQLYHKERRRLGEEG
jgi:hypothetical protein